MGKINFVYPKYFILIKEPTYKTEKNPNNKTPNQTNNKKTKPQTFKNASLSLYCVSCLKAGFV